MFIIATTRNVSACIANKGATLNLSATSYLLGLGAFYQALDQIRYGLDGGFVWFCFLLAVLIAGRVEEVAVLNAKRRRLRERYRELGLDNFSNNVVPFDRDGNETA